MHSNDATDALLDSLHNEIIVVNPISNMLPRNVGALVVSSSDAIVVQRHDATEDHLEIFDERYGTLDFKPAFIE